LTTLVSAEVVVVVVAGGAEPVYRVPEMSLKMVPLAVQAWPSVMT
jgi:hypothetical protein